jgi:hypothetical protein
MQPVHINAVAFLLAVVAKFVIGWGVHRNSGGIRRDQVPVQARSDQERGVLGAAGCDGGDTRKLALISSPSTHQTPPARLPRPM